jgi:hypothetical protein
VFFIRFLKKLNLKADEGITTFIVNTDDNWARLIKFDWGFLPNQIIISPPLERRAVHVQLVNTCLRDKAFLSDVCHCG